MADWRVELCERSYAAFSRLDLEAVLPLYERDCEWELGPVSAAVGTETYTGHDGVAALVRDIGDVFPDYSSRTEEIRSRADGALLIRFRISATSHGTSIDQIGGQIMEFGEERIRRVIQTAFPPPGWEDAEPLA